MLALPARFWNSQTLKRLEIGSRRPSGGGGGIGLDYAKMKVLVIENEMPTAMMMVSLLTEIGCDAQVATKGKRGMEIAQKQKFDLILLDTHLPDISGFEICRELKQRHISYRTPIVFLSNQRGDEYRERALELGAADFIEKPFEARGFISRISSQLEETATP